MNNEILQAKQKDFNRLLEIDTVAQSSRDRKNMIELAIGENRCWFVSNANDVLAYGIVHHHFFGHTFIDMIYVKNGERSKGIGVNLVEYFLGRFGSKKIFTSTNQSNSHMQYVLGKLGFMNAGEIGYLDPGDPEVFYVKLPTTLNKPQ